MEALLTSPPPVVPIAPARAVKYRYINSSYVLLSAAIGLSTGLYCYYQYHFFDYESISFGAMAFATATLIFGINKTIPIREIASFMFVMQLLLFAALDYRYFHPIGLGMMKIKSEVYFNYMIPAVVSMLIGLWLPLFKLKISINEVFDKLKIHRVQNLRLGLVFVLAGYFFDTITRLGINIPGFEFVVVLLVNLRFVGAFCIWFTDGRYAIWVILLVLLPFLIQTAAGGIFIEIFVWGFFIYAYIANRAKFPWVLTVVMFVVGGAFATVLQAAKSEYREKTWNTSANSMSSNKKLTMLGDLIVKHATHLSPLQLQLAGVGMAYRLNQGLISAKVLNNVPRNKPFAEGEYFKNELLGVFLPRFLHPNKPNVGDHDKFYYFTNWRLARATAMNVDVMCDGYVNFGFVGGIIYSFCFGVLINYFFHLMLRYSLTYPTIILWVPIILSFAMRAGNESYMIVNNIAKAGVFLALIYWFLISVMKLTLSIEVKKAKP